MFLQIAFVIVLLAVSYVACSDRFAPRPPEEWQGRQEQIAQDKEQVPERRTGD